MNCGRSAIQRTQTRRLFKFHPFLLAHTEIFAGNLEFDLRFSPFLGFDCYLNSMVAFVVTGSDWRNFAAYHLNTVRCFSDDLANFVFELLGFEEMVDSNF